jgi:hypothetical protein
MVVVVMLLFAACATAPTDIKVSAEADPKVNLSGYKTYAWLVSAKILNDPEGKWEPPQFDADAEIKWLIDRELRKRGIMEVTTNPDIIIGYAAGIDMEALELKENPETKMIMVENAPKGALALVFIDASTGFPIWAGVAEADIQENPSMDLVRKRLDYAVSEMFKLLPK